MYCMCDIHCWLHGGVMVCASVSQLVQIPADPGSECLFVSVCVCLCLFVSVWHCDGLVTCPGCTFPLAQWQLRKALVTLSWLRYYRWMDIYYVLLCHSQNRYIKDSLSQHQQQWVTALLNQLYMDVQLSKINGLERWGQSFRSFKDGTLFMVTFPKCITCSGGGCAAFLHSSTDSFTVHNLGNAANNIILG